MARKHKNRSTKKQVESNRRQLKMLRKMPERKSKVTSVAKATVSSGSSAYLLNGMLEGDSWGTREGQKIHMVNLVMNIYVEQATAVATHFRVMIVSQNLPQGGIITTANLLSFSGNDTLKINSVKNQVFRENYKFWYDKVFFLSGTNNEDNRTNKLIKIRKLLNMNTIYNGTNGGGILDIEKNALYLVIWFDNATTEVSHNYYIKYTDS